MQNSKHQALRYFEKAIRSNLKLRYEPSFINLTIRTDLFSLFTFLIELKRTINHLK
jgi:hypothetical protein